MQREVHATKPENGHLQAKDRGPEKKPTMPTPSPQTSCFQNNEKINLCCLSHPVFSTLLRQFQQTNTSFNSTVQKRKAMNIYSDANCTQKPKQILRTE